MEEHAEDASWSEQWRAERGRLFALAYRMLGTAADAEDVVAEAGARTAGLDPGQRAAVRSWPAYLRTMTTRIAVDRLRSAAVHREEYPGPWLPEPLPAEDLPAQRAEDRDLLSIGLLHLMEQLRPEERAAYVLRHAFAYSAPEIATVLGTTPGATRQLLSRASRRLVTDQGARPDDPEVRALLGSLVDAIAAGDVAGTTRLISRDAVLWADGGGIVRAARNPILGSAPIARFLHGISAGRGRRLPRVRMLDTVGEPCLLADLDGRRLAVFVDGSSGIVRELRVLASPAKLGRLLAAAEGR